MVLYNFSNLIVSINTGLLRYLIGLSNVFESEAMWAQNLKKSEREVYEPTLNQERELRQHCLQMMNVDTLYRCGRSTGFMTGRMNELSNWIFFMSAAVHTRICAFIIAVI